MKNIITILSITFTLLAFSTMVQAQSITLKGAPAKFSKSKFKQLLQANGLSQQEFNRICGMHGVVNLFKKVKGQWKFNATQQQIDKVSKFTNCKMIFAFMA